MTTFQAIIYGILNGFTEFLPISANAHRAVVPWLLNWPEVTGVFRGTLSLGAAIAIFVYARHDWSSMISCFIQVILFRKRPMTLDERLPIFLLFATLPSIGVWYYLSEVTAAWHQNPVWVAGGLIGFGGLLTAIDRWSRKNKGMFDWTILDSSLVGIGQTLMFIPGGGASTGSLMAGLGRNFNREAAAKFMLYALFPMLAASAYLHLQELDFKAAQPMTDLSWMSLALAFIVTFFSSLLAIGGLLKHVQRKTMGEYTLYRVILGTATLVVYWTRTT